MIKKFHFLGLILFLFGCAEKMSSCATTFTGDSRIKSGKVFRYIVSANEQDTGYVDVSYSFYADIDSTYKDSVNALIANYYQRLTEFEGEDLVNELSQEFFEAQADSFVAIYKESEGEDEWASMWEMECSIGIDDHYSTFVEVSLSEWSYTGGAHGNGAWGIHMLDKASGKLLGLSDFFKDIEELNIIAEPFFRELMELGPTESLNDAGFWFDNDAFTVNNNFSFGGDKVLFHYNTYEIAMYAGGPTDLEIPIDKIKHLLIREL